MKRLFSLFLLILCALPVHSQTAADNNSDDPSYEVFIAPMLEILWYSREKPAYGAGFAFGAGDTVTMGFRFFYTIDFEFLNTIELTIFLRYYNILNTNNLTGPFVQLDAGTCIFEVGKPPVPPAESGSLSIGLLAGWRFPLGKRWYIEPFIRAGYPYVIGAGASAAFRL